MQQSSCRSLPADADLPSRAAAGFLQPVLHPLALHPQFTFPFTRDHMAISKFGPCNWDRFWELPLL